MLQIIAQMTLNRQDGITLMTKVARKAKKVTMKFPKKLWAKPLEKDILHYVQFKKREWREHSTWKQRLTLKAHFYAKAYEHMEEHILFEMRTRKRNKA